MARLEPVRSRPRTWFGHGGCFQSHLWIVAVWANATMKPDTSRSSTKCVRNYRRYLCASRYAQPVLSCPSWDINALTVITPKTVRSNEQMMQSMKGATMLLGSMNRQMNLPALQRIAMEFERENDVMDQRQEMMDDAIDEATGMEGEEEEGEDIVKEVLDEIGVDLNQAVCLPSVIGMQVIRTDVFCSWARHPPTYRRRQSTKHGLRKPSVVEAIPATMISKPDWIAFDDNHHFCVIDRKLLIRPYPVLLFLACPQRYSYRCHFMIFQHVQILTSSYSLHLFSHVWVVSHCYRMVFVSKDRPPSLIANIRLETLNAESKLSGTKNSQDKTNDEGSQRTYICPGGGRPFQICASS